VTRLVPLAAALAACRAAPTAPPPFPPLVAAEATLASLQGETGRIALDGRLDDAAWPLAFRSPVFEGPGGSRPHTELRLATDGVDLHVALLCADSDLHPAAAPAGRAGGDSAVVTLGALQVFLQPGGVQAPAGVTARVFADGTLDAATDEDEEWDAEISVPWATLAPDPSEGVLLRAVRVDDSHGRRQALAWPPRGWARIRRAADAPL